MAQTTPPPAAAAKTARQRARDSFVVMNCVPMTRELQQFATATIATATADCLEQARYGDAARLFLLTTIDGRFDAARVGIPDNEDPALTLERLLHEQHPAAGMAALERARRALVADPASRRSLCTEIRQYGPPDDDSSYRGTVALAADAARAFHPDRTWATLVTAALDCPAD